MSPSTAARLRMAALVAVVLVAEGTFGSDLRLFGVAPDFLLVLVVAGGLVAGPQTGALFGFGVGLLADLALTTTPVGLQALAWCLVGWGVGSLRARVLPEGRVVQPVVAFGAAVAALVLFLVVGELVGQSQLVAAGRSYVLRVVVIEALWAAVLIVPATVVLGRAARGSAGADALRRPDTIPVR